MRESDASRQGPNQVSTFRHGRTPQLAAPDEKSDQFGGGESSGFRAPSVARISSMSPVAVMVIRCFVVGMQHVQHFAVSTVQHHGRHLTVAM